MTTIEDIPRRTFYVMRHAQSTGNLKPGQKASPAYPLTTRGIGQAFLKSDLLEQLRPCPDLIISSGMERAIETATMVSGQTPDEKDQEHGLDEWYSGHESEEEHSTRVMGVLFHRLKKDDAKTLFFVTHGAAMRRIFEVFGVYPETVPHASVYRFDPPKKEDGSWQVSQLMLENGKLKEEKLRESLLDNGDRRFLKEAKYILERYTKRTPKWNL